jgi:uncharacterized protein
MLFKRRPLNSVLVKPAGPDCNIACKYCFYLEKSEIFSEVKVHRMSEDILEEMVRQVMFYGEQEVSFGWQGGEPTLMGIPFFEKAVQFQLKYGKGQTVGNGLQTNGLLVNKDWAEFLSRYKFLVGLSLDGPEHVHDYYRKGRDGRGTWSRVVKSAELMLDSGVEVNALTVLNDFSVKFPEEIYEFHKSLGLNFLQFIPCLEPEPEVFGETTSFSVSPKLFGEFLCRVFDLWRKDFDGDVATTSVRFFDSVFHTYVGLPAPECTLLPECGSYVVVEYNGNIYSCDFFVENDWKLGNIKNEKSIFDMLNSPRQGEFGQLKSDISDECKDCSWLRFCMGGCTKDRRFGTKNNNLNYLCKGYKMFFEHADTELRKIAEKWMRKQMMEYQNEQRDPVPESEKMEQVRPDDPCGCGSGKKYKKCCGKIAQ